MSMVPVYIEISLQTLNEIHKDNNILDGIIYEENKRLAELNLINYDTAGTIFSALSKFMENNGTKDEVNVENQKSRVLDYDGFPGYHISYENPEEVHDYFESLQKTHRNQIEEQWLLEWFDEIYKFYNTASKNGSAILYCIT